MVVLVLLSGSLGIDVNLCILFILELFALVFWDFYFKHKMEKWCTVVTYVYICVFWDLKVEKSKNSVHFVYVINVFKGTLYISADSLYVRQTLCQYIAWIEEFFSSRFFLFCKGVWRFWQYGLFIKVTPNYIELLKWVGSYFQVVHVHGLSRFHCMSI